MHRNGCTSHGYKTARPQHLYFEQAAILVRNNSMMSSSDNFADDRLHRGEACLPCRRRKTKCDGVRPTCRACRPASRECTYTSAGTFSTQYLEGETPQLQTHAHGLEDHTHDAVILRDPYAAYAEAQTMRTSQSRHAHQQGEESEPVGSSITLQMNHEVLSMLVGKFFERGELLGFSLEKSRSIEQINLPISNPNFPHVALLNTIYLWALQILNSSASSRLIPLYVAEATRAINNARNSQDSRIRVQIIQAEALLALFFYSNGRLVEGQYHSAGAVSMALTAGLHCTNPIGAGSSSSFGNLVPTTTFILPQPHDPAEAAERTRLFWAVYSLDACWSVVSRSPPKIMDSGNQATAIKIPWPVSTNEYQAMYLRGLHATSNTIQEFYAIGQSPQNSCGVSSSTLRAQASALLKHAIHLGETEKSDDAQRKFRDMARFISSFIGSLPSVNGQSDLEPVVLLTNLVTRSLAHAAEIHLHVGYMAFSPGSLTVCINSALAILTVTEHIISEESDVIDPAIVVSV
ncbi:hypothetical protein BD410DRAFT_283360 [Rickenella mellea]|uniref:Zn(2)-C6 fungal-type domain-containing protein n=1 Tax=Rickenella mellea TaxID=50990 RepID=A0A4Y7Q2K7_9AGAM|nr:hypothetical protein BD410DRAFT_283360 [Rickenella mellea]